MQLIKALTKQTYWYKIHIKRVLIMTLIIEIIKSIFYGIIEGITEWLPISSTGHMVLFDEFVNLNVSDSFKEMFLVVIQLGAILAVVIMYFNKLNPFSLKKTSEQKKDTWLIWLKVLIASIPAGVAGVLFDDEIDAMLTGYWRAFIIAAALIVYGILYIWLENRRINVRINSVNDISYKTAFFIGIFQMLALIPGTSRSGSTILGAMLLGLARPAAAEFSFFMSIPAMFGASAIKLLKFFTDGGGFQANELAVLTVGTLVSFIVSVIAIKFLMSYIRKHDFKVFGYYRIILGTIVIIYFLIKLLAKGSL